jgi:2-polyprenyl-3-methyl-5-hydroxy-6-metoxy-1,4-benzoquinol methylase
MTAACPVCGSRDGRLLWPAHLPTDLSAREFSYTGSKKHHGQVLRCAACGHRFVHPLPPALSSFYADVTDPFYVATEAERVRTFEEFLDCKERHCASRGTLLDVGCYAGVFLDVAARRGYSVEGLELSRWAGAIARGRGHQVHEGSIDLLAGSNRRYGAITAFDVIEHLADPLAALKILRDRLEPGGCLAATVPDMGAWHARLLGRRHWLVVTMHVQYFTRDTLQRLLTAAGFSQVTITSAPPYRLRVADAAAYSNANPALRAPFALASRLPAVKHLELRLRASLFAVARP